MNYLQLAQRLVSECGISGTGPASVTSQSGEMLRVVNWIADAWREIQTSRPNWRWMEGAVSFPTISQQASYTPAQCGVTDLASWRHDTDWRIYETAVGQSSEQFLQWWDYDDWRDLYQFSSIRTSYGQPVSITELPDRSIGLGQTPDDTPRTVTGLYHKTPTTLSANSDTPSMPERFHMAIVYLAMMSYGAFEAAPEVFQRGSLKFSAMRFELELDQLPRIRVGGTMA